MHRRPFEGRHLVLTCLQPAYLIMTSPLRDCTTTSWPLLKFMPPTTSSVHQDWTLKRIVREVYEHNLVFPNCQPLDKRGVAAAIRKVGSCSAHGPDWLIMLHLRHLGSHCLSFLTERFNLSDSEVEILAIWKNSIIIPILKAGISWIRPLFSSNHHCFKPRHSTTSALLPITARVVIFFVIPQAEQLP